MHEVDVIETFPEFRRWREAFRLISGIDIRLLDSTDLQRCLWRTAQQDAPCGRLVGGESGCAACRKRFAARLLADGLKRLGPFVMRCPAGMVVVAYAFGPLDDGVAFFRTSPVFLRVDGASRPAELAARRLAGDNVRLARRRSGIPVPVCDRNLFNAAIKMLGLLAEHLSHMSRESPGEPEHNRDPQATVIVRRAREIVERRFTGNLRLDQVAQELGLSRSSLSHAFSRAQQIPFSDYLSMRRVAEMRFLLEHVELSVTETMFAAGFQSVSQANRVFRAATGMAPRDFRRRIRR